MNNYSPEVYSLARYISSQYANHDEGVVYLDDVPDFDIHELVSAIMASNSDYTSEATSFDNPAYESSMLPAMLVYLKDSTNKDKEIAFNNAWRNGVVSYFQDQIMELLNQEISNESGYEGNWFEGAYA